MRPIQPLALSVALAATAIAQDVSIGDGVESFGTFNGDDHRPFLQAIAALPRGGTVEVLAGRYRFERAVDVTPNGITIRGSAGAELVSAKTGAVGILRVEGDDFRLTGVRVVTELPPAQQVSIAVSGDSVVVDHCTFDARGGAPGVRLLELGEAATQRRGTLIDGNRFLFTPQSAGVIGVSLINGLDLRLCDNEFRKETGASGGLCRYAVKLVDESKGTITGNSFQNLATGAAPMDAVVYSQAESEGHHLAIAGNFFENCQAPTVVHLAGARFCAITGNVFGRMVSATDGVVRLAATELGANGNSNVVSGNQFHNVALGVWIGDQLWSTVEGNQFTISSSPQVSIQGSARGAMVVTNQFVASAVLSSDIPYAIQLSGGSDHMIRDNAVLSQHPTHHFAQVVSTVPAIDASIQDNWKS